MMKKIIYIISYIFIAISLISLLYVAVSAWINPHAVMALVQVKLPNNDALSSIRGVYGGVGITLVGTAAVISFKKVQQGLLFFTVFWFMYALSRIITIGTDGALGQFGSSWLKIELSFGLFALVLYLFHYYMKKVGNEL